MQRIHSAIYDRYDYFMMHNDYYEGIYHSRMMHYDKRISIGSKTGLRIKRWKNGDRLKMHFNTNTWTVSFSVNDHKLVDMAMIEPNRNRGYSFFIHIGKGVAYSIKHYVKFRIVNYQIL